MIRNLARTLGSAATIAIAFAAGACSNGNVPFDGEKGVPLAELDTSGPAPGGLAMLGPDEVVLRRGDRLAIAVEGDEEAKDALRFTLKDGTLGIGRTNWKSSGRARITVTMPLPNKLVMAGSGSIASEGMAGPEAEVSVAGSGRIDTGAVEAERLSVNIAGSGSLTGKGHARNLEVNVAGSGDAELDGLSVDDAKVSVAGSGNTRFASDGNVKASIMGSGEVRVRGRATCKVSAVGSGKLVCENAATPEAAGDDASDAPQ